MDVSATPGRDLGGQFLIQKSLAPPVRIVVDVGASVDGSVGMDVKATLGILARGRGRGQGGRQGGREEGLQHVGEHLGAGQERVPGRGGAAIHLKTEFPPPRGGIGVRR